MRSVLDRRERAGLPPLHTLLPQEARAAYERMADVLEIPRPPLPRVQDVQIPARDGHPLPARVYDPRGLPDPLAVPGPGLLFLHGGGFTVGSVQTHDILCRELARLSACLIVSLDYRLAPEHPFPTAVHDAWDAFDWLHAHGERLGLDRARLAVGGDSAGGTLAAVCALLARDAGWNPALQLLIYPGTSSHGQWPSRAHYGQGLLIDDEMIDYFFSQYIPQADREDWRFAPLLAPDVDGVAPTWLGLAECDPLVDEGLAYADKLRAAGVPVQLEVYRGVVHEFIKMGRVIPEARQFHADAARALKEALNP
jgi:acetyl esterase